MSATVLLVKSEPNAFLTAAVERLRAPLPPAERRGALRFGVDLGTATVVLCAVDADDRPVFWDYIASRTVRDGVVIDFHGAVGAVRELKVRAETALGSRIAEAVTAYPPGIPASDARACRYVLEQSEITCRDLIDEVSAAQTLIGVSDGAIVDVGGGSTGVGRFRAGELEAVSDAPGGGHHLDLIVSGALKISLDEAEQLKRAGTPEVAQLLRPGIERIAESIRRQLAGEPVDAVHLVGGALMVEGAAEVVARYLGIRAVSYPNAHLITPFGMTLS